MKAAKEWWRDEDIPDPLRRRDFVRRPDLLARAVGERIAEAHLWGWPRQMPAPKPKGGTRWLTCIDPVAEIGYRQLVWRLAGHVEAALPPSVFSTRCRVTHWTWHPRRWRDARTAFDDAVAREQGHEFWEGKGTLDVASHYPTVNLPLLATVLESAGAPPRAVRDVIDALGALQQHTPGLPIGPEASAILGTAALLPLDRRLRGEPAATFRWVDDLVAFVPGQDSYEHLKAVAQDQLGRGEQELNLKKCTYEDLRALQDPSFMDLFLSHGEDGGQLSSDPVRELELCAAFQMRDRIPALLGQLAKARRPEGIDLLRENEWIVSDYPKHAAKYLSRVVEAIDDWSWMLAIVLAETTERNALAQLRIARLVPTEELGASIAEQLIHKALTLSRRTFAPLANEIFVAAGRSQEPTATRRSRALDLALETASFDAVRALLAPFLEGSASKAHKDGIAKLARHHPELCALQELVLAA